MINLPFSRKIELKILQHEKWINNQFSTNVKVYTQHKVLPPLQAALFPVDDHRCHWRSFQDAQPGMDYCIYYDRRYYFCSWRNDGIYGAYSLVALSIMKGS
jgi:hypothetical protein